MKAWLVRFVSLYVFNVVVLLLIGWLLPGVNVGWAALWASVILTAATIWLKPAVTKAFSGMAARSASERTKAGEKVVQFGIVFVVQLIIWVLVVWFSRVNVDGWFWGWALPPLALLLAWIIYDAVDDRVESHAGALYDRATRGRTTVTDASTPGIPSPPSRVAQEELRDGLTAEQRKMLDEL